MITIRKLWNWVCNCFSNPPRPGVNLDNDCYGPNATGAGQNPLNGLICTEPPQFTPPYTQAVDPPTCYTGASPCDPMPTLWRVAFPCRVPGSTCSGTGTGSSEECCQGDKCVVFPGVTYNGACALTPDNTAGSVTLETGGSSNPASCWNGIGTLTIDGRQLQILLIHNPFEGGRAYLYVTITNCGSNPPPATNNVTATYITDTFANCAGTFSLNSKSPEEAEWPASLTLTYGSCSGTGTGSAPSPPPDCDPIEVLTHPTGPPPVVPPYQDCPSCWTASPSGISGGFGNISTACCEQLNGLRTFCYVPSISVGNSLVWGSNCVNSNGTGTGTGTGHGCFPQPADANRRKWQLEYDKVLKKWSLFSFNVVQTPRYELADEDPCTGSTKVLSLVDPGGATSGCADAPPTITITRQTDCSACSDYNEPGCQVMLVRQCGIDGYATYSYTPVSADPKLSILCTPTRGHDVQTCCDVDCDYTFSGCCPIQGTPFIGSMDPWFDRRGDIKVWDLDLAADPITLTGTFIEGNIVYEVDSYGLQCGGITKLNQVSTTLPSSLARIYPLTACMVPDELLTCNVRVPSGTGTFPDGNFTSCASAGYTDFENGQQQFCDANDTCNPSILGSIQIGDCSVPVCATRQGEVKGRDPDCLTTYPRIACVYINDGNHDNIVTQVIYPVGPGNRWASDWYCTTYNPEDPNPRNCAPCSATIGEFKGTSYANKDECDTLPFFPTPSEGMGDCHCGPIGCCESVVLPDELHMTLTGCYSVTAVLTRTGPLTWAGNDTFGVTFTLFCLSLFGFTSWTLSSVACDGITRTDSSGQLNISCSPFFVEILPFTVHGCGSCGAGGTISGMIMA